MAGGYYGYGIPRDAEEGKKIIGAIQLLHEAQLLMWEKIADNTQFDNASEDGCSIGRVGAARTILDGVLEKEETNNG